MDTDDSQLELVERLAKVRWQLDAWKVDSVLIGSPANRRWLSGFSGSAGWLLVSREQAILAADFRYWEQATIEAPHFELFKLSGPLVGNWPGLLAAGGARIGIEAQHVTVAVWEELREATNAEVIPLQETLESLRQVKSGKELELVQEAAAITDRVMVQVPQIAGPDLTEKQIAWELEKRLRESGADGLAFPIIVASGPNSALPHHRPGERRLRPGDWLLVDMGAALDGYHSDLTRTFYLGAQPDELFKEVYEVVSAAQGEALSRIMAGMSGQEVDGQARQIIEEAGYGDHFGHPLGHGIGLTLHEGPRLGPTAAGDPLPAGAVVTIEPGIYLPGRGGVRIEDLIVLTGRGPKRLSHCPYEPAIVF